MTAPVKVYGPGLGAVMLSFFREPRKTLIRHWNWKSAVTSSVVRAILFFAVNITAGAAAAWAAFWTELLFRAATAGFYGAVTQAFSTIRPAWKGALGALFLLPFFNHSLEFLVHWLRGTEVLGLSILASVGFTCLSSLFHFFSMQRGLLIVGDGSQGLMADLAQMPRTVWLFVLWPFTLLGWRSDSRDRP